MVCFLRQRLPASITVRAGLFLGAVHRWIDATRSNCLLFRAIFSSRRVHIVSYIWRHLDNMRPPYVDLVAAARGTDLYEYHRTVTKSMNSRIVPVKCYDDDTPLYLMTLSLLSLLVNNSIISANLLMWCDITMTLFHDIYIETGLSGQLTSHVMIDAMTTKPSVLAVRHQETS